MYAPLDQGSGPFVADEAEATMARKAAVQLAGVAKSKQDVKVVAVEDDGKVTVPLPARAVEVILTVLVQMANREPFSIIPHSAEMSTQQAADFLNVSRPYLVKLLDSGKIDHRVVGRHRRVKVADLVKFDLESGKERKKALAEMAEEARRLNLE